MTKSDEDANLDMLLVGYNGHGRKLRLYSYTTPTLHTAKENAKRHGCCVNQ
jgi:hypothetical protein